MPLPPVIDNPRREILFPLKMQRFFRIRENCQEIKDSFVSLIKKYEVNENDGKIIFELNGLNLNQPGNEWLAEQLSQVLDQL